MCKIISELGRTGASLESSAHELDCHEECWEFEDLGPGDKEREGSDRQEVKGQPVFDLQEQGGIRRPAERALGENSHIQTLCQEAWSEEFNLYLDLLDGQSPDWYTGLKGPGGRRLGEGG